MAVKCILFDLGGTLLHYHDSNNDDPSRPFYRKTQEGIEAILRLLDERGLMPVSLNEAAASIDRHIGLAYRATLQNLQGGSVESPIRAGLNAVGTSFNDALWAEARQAFYTVIDGMVRPRLGVPEVLEELHRAGYVMGLISNTFWAADLHDRHLDEYGLCEYFPLRLYSCDTPFTKPHPAIFNEALDTLEVSPDEAVYVGDRLDVDVHGAQMVGMYGILINSPYQMQEPGDILPDAVIDELTELPAAIAEL